MKSFSVKEFLPTILFLVKFVGIYLVGNFLYGLYVTAYEPTPDPATQWVTDQTAVVLTVCGWPSDTNDRINKPITNLNYKGKNVLARSEERRVGKECRYW